MSDAADAPPFRELRGEYVEKKGQVLNLSEYLDYFEPLGSALSRQPDGAGGPFVYQFRPGGGATVSSIGWVVSSAKIRYGGWRLWGMWSPRPIPPVALPLLWPRLARADQLPRMIDDLNHDASRLLDPPRWPDFLDGIDVRRLHEEPFRRELSIQLSKAYAAAHGGAIEVEVALETLDVLPWLYLLGPVDPAAAQLQPGRFHGPGYQYILGALPAEGEIDPDVEAIVEQTADDAVKGWEAARDYREDRTRRVAPPPPRRAAPRPQAPRRMESAEMKNMRPKPAPRPSPWSDVQRWLPTVLQVITLLLLGWLIYDVNRLRTELKSAPSAEIPEPAASVTTSPVITPPAPSRMQRLRSGLAARPPVGVRIDPRAMDAIRGEDAAAQNAAAQLAVEILLRQNACVDRSSPADAKLSAAESRAARRCVPVQQRRLYRGDELDTERALAWLERLVEP
ncbi:MAG TPA: hypothetical protein VJ276_09685 [Thermoanaerobaculia bacterium]|nr:hypothetical protein [Thermoanaerobaculia bacterium]